MSVKEITLGKMTNITINIPDIYDKDMKRLVADKIYNNRSEIIRIALSEFFQKEFDNLELYKQYGGKK